MVAYAAPLEMMSHSFATLSKSTYDRVSLRTLWV